MRRESLPSGTVTFLFTDIEGSTRLLHELGAERYAEALAEHRRVLREAFARHGGVEVDTQGDAFFVAFARASDGLAAAAAAQAALDGGRVRVRMGLHTGEPTATAEGYVGADVHKGARIAAAGHGGQVLASQQTERLADGASLVDLGEHRLKDLSAPERLFQLGPGEFPPLKTLFRTNLPIPATPFLGRERELAEIEALLARDDVRLLTLTGPGGTGKTRLALQAAAAAADDYPGGVFWAPLAPVRDAALVGATAAQALGGEGSLVEQVGDQRLLLVLDNFEHVVAAAGELSALLRECPNVDVLVTSRELLQLAGEQVYPVPSLAEPEAIALFEARARAVQPGFAGDGAVAEICTRLDNLPLALELAAARVRVFSVEELLGRLVQRLDFLKAGRDVDPRQATLRATIEWSHDLLDAEERRVFACLAVFAGGCTFEAAEHVCEADPETLVSLVDKSLVRRPEDGRLWMLETIRELAAEQLEQLGDADEVRARHARYFAELAVGLGLAMESLSAGHRQRYDVGIPEIDNFRAALRWTEDADPLLGLRLAVDLENLWVTQGLGDGMKHLETLLARAHDAPLTLRAAAFRALGSSAVVVSGELAEGRDRYAQSLALYRQAGDEWGITTLEHRLGVSAMQLEEWPQARPLLESALERARRLGIGIVEGQAIGSLASLERRDGNVRKALELVLQSAEAARRSGFDWWQASMLGFAAELAHELGEDADADRYARDGLALAHRIGDRNGTVLGVAELARLAAVRGDGERSGRLLAALEREAARTPLAYWDRAREEISGEIELAAGEAFDRGYADGRRLSLEEAVQEALREE